MASAYMTLAYTPSQLDSRVKDVWLPKAPADKESVGKHISGVCVHSRTDVQGVTQDKDTVLHGCPPNGETLPHESFEDDEQKLHEADT